MQNISKFSMILLPYQVVNEAVGQCTFESSDVSTNDRFFYPKSHREGSAFGFSDWSANCICIVHLKLTFTKRGLGAYSPKMHIPWSWSAILFTIRKWAYFWGIIHLNILWKWNWFLFKVNFSEIGIRHNSMKVQLTFIVSMNHQTTGHGWGKGEGAQRSF